MYLSWPETSGALFFGFSLVAFYFAYLAEYKRAMRVTFVVTGVALFFASLYIAPLTLLGAAIGGGIGFVFWMMSILVLYVTSNHSNTNGARRS